MAARNLVVTVPHIGDVEQCQQYLADAFAAAPMVTWHPTGGSESKFCLVLMLRTHNQKSLQILWLVCDMPGSLPGDDLSEEPCYGLAGNFAAVERGTHVIPYGPPPCNTMEPSMIQLILFEQSNSGSPLAPKLNALQKQDFLMEAFVAEHGLGPAQATEQVNLVASVTPPLCVQAHATSVGDVVPGPLFNADQRPLAHSCGGDLVTDPSAPTTLTAALQRTATDMPSRGLTIYEAEHPKKLTYAKLYQCATQLSNGLCKSGFQPGHAALLQVPTLAEHFTIFWGCLLCRVRPVAVAIPPNYDDAAHAVCGKIRNVWKLLEGPVLITTDSHRAKVDLLRKVESMSSMRSLTVEELDRIGSESGLVSSYDSSVQPTDVAFYQLSSGSTGVPKCIQIAHRGVVAHIHGEAQYCKIGPDDIHVSFLPVDHVVPILTVHCCDVYHGCEEVQADVAWVISEPIRWLRLLTKHRATRTWSPNFAFKLVADTLRNNPELGEEALDLSSCRYFMNAGEQVTIPVCEEFLEQTRRYGVKRSSMQPSFGMAEACTCMTYNNDFENSPASRLDRSTFVNLGPPVPGVEIRIADVDNRAVSEDTIGRFQIRGAVITPGYLKNDEANKDAFVGEGWFNTGDVGFLRHGCLHLTGREKEMIIIRGANFYCYEIEDSVSSLPSVTPTFVAAVSAHDPTTGSEGLAVFFVPRNGEVSSVDGENSEELVLEVAATAAREVRAGLIRHISLTPSHVVPVTRTEFPKTTSGKIQRSQLSKALQAGEFNERLTALAELA